MAKDISLKEGSHFEISASVISQLGDELISDEVTALMELVKNAYDAGTKSIKIILSTDSILTDEYYFHGDKGYVTISDFGSGMDDEAINKNWLVISRSQKREMKEKNLRTKDGRIPLGDKGLGRLSTQKIARNIELRTKIAGEEISRHVAFSWDSFTSDLMINQVPLKRFTKPANKSEKGTTIILSNLKNPEVWKREAKDRFRGQISQLVYPIMKKRPIDIYLEIDKERQDFNEINNNLKNLAAGFYNFNFFIKKGIPTVKIKGTVRLKKIRGNTTASKAEYSKIIANDFGRAFFKFLTSADDNKTECIEGLEYLGVNKKTDFFSFDKEVPVRNLETLVIRRGNNSISKKQDDVSPFLLPYQHETSKDQKKKSVKANDYDLEIDNVEEQRVWAIPGDFEGELYDIPKDELSPENKSLVENLVGVRVYKDGFGVKPYGFAKNDWLHLGQTWSSGSSYYGLKPGGTVGFVSLTLEKNYILTEKTDREGFIDSPFSRNFYSIIADVAVKEINSIVERTRRSFTAYRKRFYADSAVEVLSHKHSIGRILAAANKAKAAHKNSDVLTKRLSDFTSNLEEYSIDQYSHLSREDFKKILGVKQILAESSNYLAKAEGLLDEVINLENDGKFLDPLIEDLEERAVQFAELAGLGLTAEALTHELYHLLDRASIHLGELVKQIKKRDFSQPYEHTEGLSDFLKSLRIQVNHLSPILKYNRERKDEIHIKEFLSELADFFKNRTNNIEINIETKRGFTIKINRGKLSQVFDNLLFNSEYWLKEKRNQERRFKPLITLTIESPFVRIEDNGYGIDQFVVDRLFQPFVTTKPKGIGRGLGLYITKNILENAECEIALLPDRNRDNNRYIFQIDFSSLIF
jgi:signal transduction histidine kinase